MQSDGLVYASGVSDAPRYEAHALIGSGGVGRVYQAVHRPSGRAVAIKTIGAGKARADAQRLLVREAAAAAQLRHPHVVELLDFVVANGRPYLVLELVDGYDVERWLDEWPGWPVVADALDQVLDALSTAHAAGILHRDLKPANLLYSRTGAIKITDFGMAELVDPLAPSEVAPLGGTPLYMAPEQLDPFAHQGPWTDLYALGVILYLLLTGREPVALDQDNWKQAKKSPPRRFQARSGLSIPGELERLILALVDPDPNRRPRFAADVRAELRLLRNRAHEVAVIIDAPSSQRSPSSIASAPTTAAPSEPPLASASGMMPFGPSRELASAPTVASDSDSATETHRPTLQPTPPLPELPFVLPAPAELSVSSSLIRLRPPPLVARKLEQRSLMDEIERARLDRRATALTLIGEAGVGKSRLARWALGEVERRGLMESTAAGYDVSGTTDGVRQALRRLLGPAHEMDQNRVPGAWKRFGLESSGIDLEKLHTWLESAPGTAKLSAQEKLALATTALLQAARVRPLYVWFDDVAWARDGALELCKTMLDADDAPIAFALTVRAGAAEHPEVQRAFVGLRAHDRARELAIGRLGRDDRLELLHAAASLSNATSQALADALDETPLVLVQLVQHWIEDGTLTATADGYVAREGVQAVLAAQSMAHLFGERIGKLLTIFAERAGDAEAVLLRAALLGQRFDERAIRGTATKRGERAFAESVLGRALLHGILRAEPDGAYRFEHGLLRDAVLERLDSRSDRNAVLDSVARAVIKSYGLQRPDVRVRAAELLARANELDRALVLLIPAACDLALVSSFAQARELIDRAGRWVDENPNDSRRALIFYLESVLAYFELRYDDALEKSRAGIVLARRAGDRLVEIQCKTAETSILFYQGQLRESERVAREALDACSLEDPETFQSGVHSAHRLAEINVLRADLEQARRYYSIAREFAGRDPGAPRVGFIMLDIAELDLVRGDLESARSNIERLSARATRPESGQWRDLLRDTELRLAIREGLGIEALDRIRTRASELERRGDAWRLTSMRLLEALALADGSDVISLRSAVARFVECFERCLHEKTFTLWALDELAKKLQTRGLSTDAERVAALLAGLKLRFARAFEEQASA